MKAPGQGTATASLLDSMRHRADPLAGHAMADLFCARLPERHLINWG